jgi:hypothetical protein
MAAEYGREMVPLHPGQMRAATADRERAIDVLKAAFAEGRLTQDEYTDRVGRVYASRTYGELGALTADLPAGPLGAIAPPQPAPPAPYRQPPPYLPAARRGRPFPLLLPVLILLAVGSFGAGPEAAAVILPVLAILAVTALVRLGRR